MSKSGLPNTIFLEFRDKNTKHPRLVGTDAIAHIDGRLTKYNAIVTIEQYALKVTDRRPDLELYGYTIPRDYANKVHSLLSHKNWSNDD